LQKDLPICRLSRRGGQGSARGRVRRVRCGVYAEERKSIKIGCCPTPVI